MTWLLLIYSVGVRFLKTVFLPFFSITIILLSSSRSIIGRIFFFISPTSIPIGRVILLVYLITLGKVESVSFALGEIFSIVVFAVLTLVVWCNFILVVIVGSVGATTYIVVVIVHWLASLFLFVASYHRMGCGFSHFSVTLIFFMILSATDVHLAGSFGRLVPFETLAPWCVHLAGSLVLLRRFLLVGSFKRTTLLRSVTLFSRSHLRTALLIDLIYGIERITIVASIRLKMVLVVSLFNLPSILVFLILLPFDLRARSVWNLWYFVLVFLFLHRRLASLDIFLLLVLISAAFFVVFLLGPILFAFIYILLFISFHFILFLGFVRLDIDDLRFLLFIFLPVIFLLLGIGLVNSVFWRLSLIFLASLWGLSLSLFWVHATNASHCNLWIDKLYFKPKQSLSSSHSQINYSLRFAPSCNGHLRRSILMYIYLAYHEV